MIDPGFFYAKLGERGTEFFTGVPDSLLKGFCAYITVHAEEEGHVAAVNEGAAVALASGYYLATEKIPLVYMQNSGIGNAVNPLLSLADPEVYSIPLLLVVGWRGEPGVYDEPQHVKQGKVTEELFRTMGIPCAVLDSDQGGLDSQLDAAYAHLRGKNSPYAFLVRKDTFAPYPQGAGREDIKAEMSREDAIEEILRFSREGEFFFSTTGMASRELYELREKLGQGHRRDFLTVGSMGHASQIALGAALRKPGLRITCIDGDGAALMHLGALAAIGNRKPRNFRHILLNNGAHDSVGGQPTIAGGAGGLDFSIIARACGYESVYSVHTRITLRSALERIENRREGPVFLEVQVRKGARKDLGRPKSPLENKRLFMNSLKEAGDL
ncbi:MAG: phosphonopyruvate decarboxylase [Treponema sp.]|nr:phosphonopyruvate decarboxylase [Treponema sp.]